MTGKPPAGRERRRLKRFVKRIPAAFEAGGLRGNGHVKNLSKEGLFLRTDNPPAAGVKVRVLFHNRDGSKVEVNGRVAWTTEQLPEEEAGPEVRPGFGMHFVGERDEYLTFFEQIMTW